MAKEGQWQGGSGNGKHRGGRGWHGEVYRLGKRLAAERGVDVDGEVSEQWRQTFGAGTPPFKQRPTVEFEA